MTGHAENERCVVFGWRWLRTIRGLSSHGTNLPFGEEAHDEADISRAVHLAALNAEADRLRDGGDPTAAAQAYAAALAVDPTRTDLRVQYANMLKDSRQYALARIAYEQAQSEREGDADIPLQLGHLLKLTGQRTKAIDAYRRVLTLQPGHPDAERELAVLGEADQQQAVFTRFLQAGGPEALLAVADEMRSMRDRLDLLLRWLPDLAGQAAFPLAQYTTFRRIWDVPAPDAPAGPITITVVLGLDDLPPADLHAQLTALGRQTFTGFEAVLYARGTAARQLAERLAASDTRFRFVSPLTGEAGWQTERRLAESAGGDWVLLPAPCARLHRHALSWVAWAATATDAAAFICDQETNLDTAAACRREAPVFRQAVDFDTLLGSNPYGDTVAVRCSALQALTQRLPPAALAGLRSAILLDLAKIGLVGHLPLPLVSLSPSAAACRGAGDGARHHAVVAACLTQWNLAGQVTLTPAADAAAPAIVTWRPGRPDATLSVIIPTRNNAPDAAAFVNSLRATADRPDRLAVVVVDNGSDTDLSLGMLAELARTDGVAVLRRDEPFNWSRLNNVAAATTGTDLLVFANDDMLMLSGGWDGRLRGLLERPDVGAVGARLLYEDGTLQHAGVLFGWNGGVIHDGLYEPGDAPGPTGRWQIARAAGAVTGAFLATRRALFESLGGFDERSLAVSYGDIDYGLRLRLRGLRMLYDPAVTLTHAESKSRGLDHMSPEKAARDRAEHAVMVQRWGTTLDRDPGVNPIWVASTLPFRMIAPPRLERIEEHIRTTASRDPWHPTAASL